MTLKMDPHATEPAGEELISYADLEKRIDQWEQAPRARVYRVGRSRLNRNIFLIALSHPENLARAEHIRRMASQSWRSLVRYPTLGEPQIREVDPVELANRTKPVLLLHCASYCFEAAHVEAGVKCIESLLDGGDSQIEKLMSSAIV